MYVAAPRTSRRRCLGRATILHMPLTVVASASLAPGDAAQALLTVTGSEPGLLIALTGSQTYNIDLAMIPANGCQCWMVRVEMTDANGAPVSAPVRVNFTPGGYRMIPPGGAILEMAPKTTVGITTLQLVSTANALVHVTVGG